MKITGTFVPIIVVKSETENAFYKIKKARKTKMLKNRVCVRCGTEYNPDSQSQRYCLVCRPIVYEEMRQARYERRRARIEQARKEARRQKED